MSWLRDILGIAGFLLLCIGIWKGYGWWHSLIVAGLLLLLAAVVPTWREYHKREKRP